jgi:hypothetical protein
MQEPAIMHPMQITTSQRRGLWRVLYAMRFRRTADRPSPFTDEQWRAIEEAQAHSPGPNTYSELQEAGLVEWVPGAGGALRLTAIGRAALGI